jgi:hypothetical protein
MSKKKKQEINLNEYLDLEKKLNEDLKSLSDLTSRLGFVSTSLIHIEDIDNILKDKSVCIGCVAEAALNIKKTVINLIIKELDNMKNKGKAC